jgi:hypothetical protein
MNLPKFPAADKRPGGRSLAFFQHYSFRHRRRNKRICFAGFQLAASAMAGSGRAEELQP